jgi:hypothetical protein
MNPPPVPPAPALPQQTPPKTSGLAITALVLGVISVMGAAILIVPTLLAIILGHVAMGRIRKTPGLGGHGLALAGCILGYVSIVFGIFFAGLLAAMAIPAFQKVREESLRKTMINDARQLGAAAQQHMMETGSTEVAFDVDPATGAISGPLSIYIQTIMPGTRAIDGIVEEDGSFSLQNPRVSRGQEIAFDLDGNPL